jgi:uncharacterized repeat protein (TIGR01451 family)/fimbrial isopeptide formation D2 family protein
MVFASGAAIPVNNSAGNTVDIAVAGIPVGGSVTVMYQATLNANVPAGLTIANTANLNWSSLPGGNGTVSNPTGSSTPGASGSGTGERTNSTSAQAQVAVATPTIAKLAPTPATYAIGSDVTYDIRVTLPEGETRNLVVADDLPAGMSYVSHSIVTASGGALTGGYNGSALAPTLAPATPADGDALTFTFGAVTTAADNDPTTNSFLVRVVARVNNVSANVNGTTLRNDASLSYTNPNTNATVTTAISSRTITVIEPKLQIVKTPNTNTPKCGDTVTYTLVVSHTAASTATAYDAALTDVIPAGLSYVAGSLRLVSGSPAPAVLNEASGTINAEFTSFPLAGTVTLEYKAQVPKCPPGAFNQMFTNTVNLAWTSQTGANANERTGAGGVNNYSAGSSAKVTITQPSIITAKINNPVNGAPLMPGDMVTYTIAIQNTGNAPATGVTFTDAIPANTSYVAGSTQINGAAIADAAGPSMPFAAGGPVNTPGEPAGTVNNGETATVVFKVTINSPLPPGVTQVANEGLVKGANIPDTPTNIVINPVTGNPMLGTVKTVNNLTRGNLVPAQPGDLLEYLVVVTNNGNVAATSATLTDAIPANTTYQAASTTLNGAAVADIAGAMPYVSTSEIHSPFAPAGQLNAGAVNTPVAGNPVLNPTKDAVNLTNSSGPARPGDVLEYTIVVANTGNTASTGSTLRDSIPANTAYVAGSTTLNSATVSDVAGAMPYELPREIHSPLAPNGVVNVGAANAAVVRFRVRIDDPLPAGFTQVVNAATANGNGPNGPIGPIDSPPVITPVGATPVLTALKSVTVVGGGQAAPGSTLEYTVVVTNNGNITSVNSVLSDAIPAFMSYVAGSTTLNGSLTTDITSSPISRNRVFSPAARINASGCNLAAGTSPTGPPAARRFAVVATWLRKQTPHFPLKCTRFGASLRAAAMSG